MEIWSEPYNSQIKDTSILCPCCNNKIEKYIKKRKYVIDECRECRGTSSFSTICKCIYGEKDYLYMSCKTCILPKCVKCKSSYTVDNCCNKNCGNVLCILCMNWDNKTLEEKLITYKIEKLKMLAKNKNIKYSKYKKHELISILLQLVNENDTPRIN